MHVHEPSRLSPYTRQKDSRTECLREQRRPNILALECSLGWKSFAYMVLHITYRITWTPVNRCTRPVSMYVCTGLALLDCGLLEIYQTGHWAQHSPPDACLNFSEDVLCTIHRHFEHPRCVELLKSPKHIAHLQVRLNTNPSPSYGDARYGRYGRNIHLGHPTGSTNSCLPCRTTLAL